MQGKPPIPPEASRPAQPERRGSAGPRAIAEVAARLTRRPLGKRGFTEASLIGQWASVVGAALAATTLPLRITFPPGERAGGVLHLRVASGAMATQVQHLEPLVVQRINGHFGYRAVARLALSQGPVPRPPARRAAPEPQLDAAAEDELARRLAVVEDDDLKAALSALGRRIAAAPNKA